MTAVSMSALAMEQDFRALVVEDSEDDYRLLLRELSKNNLPIVCTRIEDETSMKSALASSWDLIISDFSLPRFCGLKALDLYREAGLDVPFIILSGTIGEDSAVTAMKAGASDYIMKHQMAKLAPAIRRELEASRSRKLHKESQRRLMETEEQLRQAQKMEAIGRLAGCVAHDFNNMLSAVGLYCDRILRTGDIDSIVAARKIKNIQDRAAHVTRQLLSFARKQAPETEAVDLNAAIGGMQEVLRDLAGPGVDIALDLQRDLPSARAALLHVEQSLMNLAINARDAMQGEGRLEIRTREVRLEAPKIVGMTDLPAGTYAVLEVADSGSGIDATILPKIFEPFFTTKPMGKGTGFGLSMVFGFARQHGGAVDVASAPGEGATFSLYLPVFSKPAAAPEKSVAPMREGEMQILLIEDDDELRDLLRETLRVSGFEVIAAGDTETALDLLKRKDPALIISDLSLPNLFGDEFTARLREKNGQSRLLLMSGHALESFDLSNLGDQSVAYLEKPFDQSRFIHRVRSILNSEEAS